MSRYWGPDDNERTDAMKEAAEKFPLTLQRIATLEADLARVTKERDSIQAAYDVGTGAVKFMEERMELLAKNAERWKGERDELRSQFAFAVKWLEAEDATYAGKTLDAEKAREKFRASL